MIAARLSRVARLWRAWRPLINSKFTPVSAAAMEPLEGRVLLSAASGVSFSLSQRTPISSFMVAVGDFNNDGFNDVVSVSPGLDSIHIEINRGNGTFATVHGFHIQHPRWATVADFNGDGNQDIAVISSSGKNSHYVNLLYGHGDGTFSRPVRYSTRVDAVTVTHADFNRDGLQDLAFSNRGRISVMLNRGAQGFAPPVFYEAGSGSARQVVAGDFNGDGAPDLAVVRTTGKVDVLLNQTPAGAAVCTFGIPTPYLVGTSPQTLVTADFNHDGKLDLATVNSDFRIAPVSVLLGNGDGTFQPRRNYFGGNFVDALAVGDFTGHGNTDIATSSFTSALRIYPGNGDGTFQPPALIQKGSEGLFAVAADFNNDGRPDLMIASGGGFRVLLNTSGAGAPPGAAGALDASIGAGGQQSVKFRDARGVVTTIRLSGPGTGVIHLTGGDLARVGNRIIGNGISIDTMTLAGTTAASTLSVTTNTKSGVVNANAIVVHGALKALDARPVLLRGNCTIDNTAGVVTFDTVAEGTISIGHAGIGAGRAPLDLNITRADGASLDSAEPVRLLSAGQWVSTDGSAASITAPGIGSIRSMGAFGADLHLAGLLGAFDAQDVLKGAWAVTGRIGSIRVHSLKNLSIVAGGGIGSISVARSAGGATFVNTHITAAIAKADLGAIAFANGGQAFGIDAPSIALLSGEDAATRRTFIIRRPVSSEAVAAALAARGITPGDFQVHFLASAPRP